MKINLTHYLIIGGEQVLVTEEVYYEYMRTEWREVKQDERERECKYRNTIYCSNIDGKINGKKECVWCDYHTPNRPLSFEKYMYEDELPVHGDPDPLEELIENYAISYLRSVLSMLEPENHRIIDMYYFNDMTERQIAEAIGLSQKGVNKRKAKILRQLRELMEGY